MDVGIEEELKQKLNELKMKTITAEIAKQQTLQRRNITARLQLLSDQNKLRSLQLDTQLIANKLNLIQQVCLTVTIQELSHCYLHSQNNNKKLFIFVTSQGLGCLSSV